jgi:hypothetical protein
MGKQKSLEVRGGAQLWRRRGTTTPRYFVTSDGYESAELPGREAGYPCPELAWQAFQVRQGIAREIDLNGG